MTILALFWTLVLETQLATFHSRFTTKSYLLLVTSLLLASAHNIWSYCIEKWRLHNFFWFPETQNISTWRAQKNKQGTFINTSGSTVFRNSVCDEHMPMDSGLNYGCVSWENKFAQMMLKHCVNNSNSVLILLPNTGHFMANDNIVRMLSVSMQGNVNVIMKMSLQTGRLVRMRRCPEKIRSA